MTNFFDSTSFRVSKNPRAIGIKAMTRLSSSKIARALALSVTLLGGCGTGALPPDYQPGTPDAGTPDASSEQPPITTLHGTVAADNTQSGGDEIRVALVWNAGTDGGHALRLVTQDVATTNAFPAAFQFETTEPPPPAALRPGGAFARVIAYRDLNHNQMLDFTPTDADAFVDRLVGYDTNMFIAYYPDGPDKLTLLINGQQPISTPIVLPEVTLPNSSCYLIDGWTPRFFFQALAAGHPANIDTGPWMTEILFPPYPQSQCPGLVPPMPSEALYCQEDTELFSEYEASWSTPTSAFIATTCGTMVRFCSMVRDNTEPPVVDWPCPCDPSMYNCVTNFMGL